MRVLLIADTLSPTYGWGRYAIGLIRALQRQQLSFHLLSPRHLCQEPDLLPPATGASSLEGAAAAARSTCGRPGMGALQLRRTFLHDRVTSFVSETRRIERLIAANFLPIRRALADCDAVHCITEPYAVPAALAAMLARKPLLVTLHGTYAVRPFTRPRERWWYELAYRRAARLLPVSQFTRSLLPARFQGPKTHIVPEGVDLSRFGLDAAPQQSALSGQRSAVSAQQTRVNHQISGRSAEHETWRSDVGPAVDRPYLLSVGPLKRRKGYHCTLEAFARVHAARPDVEYRIVGGIDDPVFHTRFLERVAVLGLQDSVRLLGRVDDADLVRLYRQCAAFWLLPVNDDLQFEGFGLVYWEANACGRPVVGALGSGAEDAIVDGENGFLVAAGDAETAAARVLALLNDPGLAERMGQTGRRRVRPWDHAASLMLDHYRAVIRPV